MLHEPPKSSSHIEPEDEDFELKIEIAPARKENIYKRKSDEMEDGGINGSNQVISDPDMNPPPAKRRTTRASSSIVAAEKTSNKSVKNDHEYDMEIDDVQSTAPARISTIKKGSQTGAKIGKKGTSSTIRKASATSTAPRASSKDIAPSDDALEAALEADLDRPLTDNESEIGQCDIVYPKMRRLTRTRPGSRDGPPSLALERRITRLSSPPLQASSLEEQDSHPQVASRVIMGQTRSASRLTKENILQNDGLRDVSAGNANDACIQMKTKQTKSKQSAKGRLRSRQLSKRDAQADAESLVPSSAADLPSSRDSPTTLGHVSHVGEDESGNETDVSVTAKSPLKRGGEKGKQGKQGKQGKNATLISPKIKKVVRRELENYSSQPAGIIATAMNPVKNATTTVPSHDIQMASLNTEGVLDLVDSSEITSRSKSFLEPLGSVKSVERSGSQTPTQSTNAVQPVDQALNTHLSGLERESTPSQAFPVVEKPACTPSVQTNPRPALSPQSSDVENQPPSSRPSSVRPPLLISSPSKSQVKHIPLITTPSTSPSKRNKARLQSTMPWSAIDYDKIFLGSPADKENNPFTLKLATNGEMVSLTSPEKKLSLEEWIQFNAQKGEEQLRSECERVVGKFEGEGVRALKTLEGITCID